MPLSEAAAAALKAATASRGPNKGRLLSRPPHYSTLAYGAWQGAMMSVNAYRASIGGMMCMSPEQRAICQEVQAAIDALPKETRVALQRDRLQLENLGVW